MRRPLWIGLAAVLVAALLAFAHIWHWYRPRARAAVPRPGSPVAALLASERFPAVLWLPYPHQNLGALAPADAAYEDYLAAAARLLGVPPPVLPSFGGFAIVPSSEIALGADESGEHFVVMAQVYPLLARFARLAGRLAANPWLAGGTVSVRDRPAAVAWQGDVWIVRDAGSRLPALSPPAASGTVPATVPTGPSLPSLAELELRADAEPFPAGRYRLTRDAGGFEVRAATLADPRWQAANATFGPELVLLVAAGPSPARSSAHALAFFVQDAGSLDLPRAASFNRFAAASDGGRAGRRWKVPGADLARLAGGLRQERDGPWEVAALGGDGMRAARALLPRLEPLAGAPGGAAGTGLAWLLAADLDNTLVEVERVSGLIDGIALIPARERRRWRDAVTVLRPVARAFDTLTVAVAGPSGSEPAAVRARLEARQVPAHN